MKYVNHCHPERSEGPGGSGVTDIMPRAARPPGPSLTLGMTVVQVTSSFILLPSAFCLLPSSFILHPSSFYSLTPPRCARPHRPHSSRRIHGPQFSPQCFHP